MYPALREGDSLLIRYFEKPLEIEKLFTGQIVILKEGSEWVVHRVIQKDNKKMTKGDWSYPIDSSLVAWGEVIAINGGSVKVTNSPYIAKISAQLNMSQPRFLRLCKKVQLIFVSTLLRNLIERRSL